VKQVRGKNKIEIEFKDEDELERILSQITHTPEDDDDEY
jgi:ParB family chromosome partitioning protein